MEDIGIEEFGVAELPLAVNRPFCNDSNTPWKIVKGFV